jgi:hypothetical protein
MGGFCEFELIGENNLCNKLYKAAKDVTFLPVNGTTTNENKNMKNEIKSTARATASKTGEPGPADTRNENEIKTLYLFERIAVPVKTWGEYRGQVRISDVVGFKLGGGADETADEFFIQNAMKGGTELSIREEEYLRAKPATKYDLMRARI